MSDTTRRVVSLGEKGRPRLNLRPEPLLSGWQEALQLSFQEPRVFTAFPNLRY